MKQLMFIITFLLSVLQLSGQGKEDLFTASLLQGKPEKEKEKCDTRVERTDSVINYTFDSATSLYTPGQVTSYSYDNEYNVTEVFVKKLPERTFIYRQLFQYDKKGNQIRYSYFQWVSGT
jgi:hypothetical protein